MYFVFLSSLPLLPPASRAVFGSYLSTLSNLFWHCIAGAGLPNHMMAEVLRFRGTNKEDERGPLSIQSSLGFTVTPSTLSPPSTVGQLITHSSILIVLVTSWDDKHPHWPLPSSMGQASPKSIEERKHKINLMFHLYFKSTVFMRTVNVTTSKRWGWGWVGRGGGWHISSH